ncbi:MAG: sigma-S stabilization anti-adapter protein IraP [Citrobacter sp.]|jgi:hypothetical protein|uniref:Anti-RssB factor n=1 Tax=Citrobacter tructae TaxID=2562449 RepID=A0ABX5T639_9ENTR|nr:sigma-S stabilization anti-adapter protein IraP [Citrobacter tructae]QBX80991.1 anti-RssB factor [Citrobacter tructae]
MKNLVTELLLKLAQKEEESEDLAAQVETLERVIMEMLHTMAKHEQQILIRHLEGALAGVSRMPACLANLHDAGERVPGAY